MKVHITHTEKDKNRSTHKHTIDYRYKQNPKSFQRERQIMSEGMTIKMKADFSPAAAGDSKQRHKALRVKNCQPSTSPQVKPHPRRRAQQGILWHNEANTLLFSNSSFVSICGQ